MNGLSVEATVIPPDYLLSCWPHPFSVKLRSKPELRYSDSLIRTRVCTPVGLLRVLKPSVFWVFFLFCFLFQPQYNLKEFNKAMGKNHISLVSF